MVSFRAGADCGRAPRAPSLRLYAPCGRVSGIANATIATAASSVTRAADALSVAPPAASGTIYEKYWDLATAAWVETVAPYTGGAALPMTGTVSRAYAAVRIVLGTLTLDQILTGDLN